MKNTIIALCAILLIGCTSTEKSSHYTQYKIVEVRNDRIIVEPTGKTSSIEFSVGDTINNLKSEKRICVKKN